MILAIKTDGDPTEIFALDADGKILRAKSWSARRTLARDLDREIADLTDGFSEISGVVVFAGPGSFTGLRIGITVANALAYAKNIPVVAASGENWRVDGIAKLGEKSALLPAKSDAPTEENGVIFREKSELENSAQIRIALPVYGEPAHITRAQK